MNGFCDSSKPSSTLVGRERTWAVMRKPSLLASSISASSVRQLSGRTCDCSIEMVMGRPDSLASRRNRPISPIWSSKSDTICSQPAPVSRMAWAIAVSSASSARKVGMLRPSAARWFNVREVEKPSAPARRPSVVSSAMRRRSASVAGSRLAPRSPIT